MLHHLAGRINSICTHQAKGVSVTVPNMRQALILSFTKRTQH